jgi:hypothetical protein
MGTIGDWGKILGIAVFTGLYGWARYARRNPYPSLSRSLAGWFLLSIALGIWFSFHWRAFRVPLVFITVPLIVGGGMLHYLSWPRGSQQAAVDPSTNNGK